MAACWDQSTFPLSKRSSTAKAHTHDYLGAQILERSCRRACTPHHPPAYDRPMGRTVGARLLLLVSVTTVACAASGGAGQVPTVPEVRHASAPENHNWVVQIAVGGGTAFALTRSSRLQTAWALGTRVVQTLDREGVVRIARDGTVALATTGAKRRWDSVTVEAWEPRSGRVVASRRLEAGLRHVLAVSQHRALMDIEREVHQDFHGEVPQMPPPDHNLVEWDLVAATSLPLSQDHCDTGSFSSDGKTLLCDMTLMDRSSHTETWPPPLAPEWLPPPRRPARGDEELILDTCPKCHPPDLSDVDVLSTWLSRDGRAVYLTYKGMEVHKEWRLERWLPGAAGPAGRLERLAVERQALFERVLGASGDGQVVVTADSRRVTPTVFRRAPSYAPQPLSAPPATAAAFTDDDMQLITGHSDGTLRLWDVRTGRLLATVGG